MKNAKTTKGFRLTEKEIKNDSIRDYNPSIWLQRIDSYKKFEDVEFYKIEKGNGYDYDRFFVSYTLPQGLRIFDKLSYSVSITNGGFDEVFIFTYDFQNNRYLKDNEVLISINKVRCKLDGKIEMVSINNTKEAVDYMTNQSKAYKAVWTKIGI